MSTKDDRVNATYHCRCGESWTETNIPISNAGPVARCKAITATRVSMQNVAHPKVTPC